MWNPFWITEAGGFEFVQINILLKQIWQNINYDCPFNCITIHNLNNISLYHCDMPFEYNF